MKNILFIKLLCIAFLLGLPSCEQESMPNGYSLYKRSKGGFVIVDGNSKSRLEVINPDIERLSVLGDLVVGEAREVKEIDGYITPGKYFLLDTKIKSSKEGLTMNELKKLLANKYGVLEVPELKRISRL